MPDLGRPYDPGDPDGDHTFTGTMRSSDLAPHVDLSGGVQLADREGVWAHSFRCQTCRLHFVLFSWTRSRHTRETIMCPECGARNRFMHRITQLSTSTTFNVASDREPEIYDVWPFRLDWT